MIEKGPFIYRVFLIIFWVGTCFGFVAEELFPPLNGLKSYLFLLFDFTIVFLCFLTLREKWQKWSISIFVILSYLSTVLLSKYSLITYVNGCRDFFGIVFAIPVITYLYRTNSYYGWVNKFDSHLRLFLIVQCFCSIWQFLKYGACDDVGGSFGSGYSGILSMVVYIISFYLMMKKFDSDNFFDSLKANWIYIIFLLPSFLNETKASFIYLLFYFLLLAKINLRTVVKLLALSPVFFGAFVGLFYMYSVITKQNFEELTGLDFYEEYLVGQDADKLIEESQMYYDGVFDNADINEWATDLPRFTKILLLSSVLEDSKGGLIFGEGVGQMKGHSVLKMTRFASQNEWYLTGTRTWVMTCVIQIGLIGFLWFLWVLLKSFNFFNKRTSNSLNVKLYLCVFVLFMQIYNDAFSNLYFCIIYFYIVYSTLNFEKSDEIESITVS